VPVALIHEDKTGFVVADWAISAICEIKVMINITFE
jgi:hypothetical protein